MEAFALRSLISSATQSFSSNRSKTLNTPFHLRRISTQQVRPFGFTARLLAKQSDLQDFQSYVRPSRLLPASDVKLCTSALIEKISLSLKEDKSKSLFRVKLGTSNIYGSSLSNLNAGILLCVIDEDGNSMLQRIPASLMTGHFTESGDINDVDMFHFQRGSVDEFIYEGPKILRVKALWVSVESGQWRLGSVSLTVISCECQHSSLQEEDGVYQYTGFQYDFELEDVLLGEGSDSSMLELRPSLVTELAGNDPFIFFSKGISDGTPLLNPEISNEESMKEYADLKLSLLLYDAILIIFGTSVASISAGENSGFAFLIGGIGGFLYLLLLQRSVDRLPASELFTSNRRGTNPNFDGFKGPISGVALAIGFAIFAARYISGDLQVTLTPKELVVGMMGFLACKVSVVLAAFKPITIGLKLPNDM